MSNKNAFQDPGAIYNERGLTKREYFAIRILATVIGPGHAPDEHDEKRVAYSVDLADELIRQLEMKS
jgi:hypothetical protein